MQNAALRIVTTCYFKTGEERLHHESNLLLVGKLFTIFLCQYLAKCGKTDRPSQEISLRDRYKRNIHLEFRKESDKIAQDNSDEEIKYALSQQHAYFWIVEGSATYPCVSYMAGRQFYAKFRDQWLPEG